MEIRLLGPVGVWHGERPLGPSAAQQRTVLAVLALETGHAVPVERLVGALWGARPPAAARNAVQGCVARLRAVLGSAGVPAGTAELDTSPLGYRLTADVDLHRFRELVWAARRATPERGRELVGAALRLWRGPALAGAAGPWLAEVAAPRLEEERFAALELRARLDLALGRHREVADDLAGLVAEFPTREHLALALLTALDRSGRRVEALEVFRRVRQRFIDEIGIEPGDDLQRAHRALLAGAPVRPAGERTAIRQLPASTAGFVGRDAELDRLDTGDGIWVISGTAGVGKTTLALHWARRAADRFPDGQLHVDLRGFGPAGTPAGADETLPTLLRTLQVPAGRIPATLDGQIALYRSLLADRRMAIVLDNARDAEQVRPLLPGADGCVVVVTSRAELTGLLVTEGARPLPLGLLDTRAARDLLAGRIGADRANAEPAAVDRIIARCAGLPLALAIMAARAAAKPALPLDALLREPGLDVFDGGDPATRVSAVLSWSYRALGGPAARLFRLLGLHPGPDITAPAATSLAGVPAAPLLAELARAHLVREHAPGRYTFHDLLRAYAAGLAAPDPGAIRRLLDHYLHTAYAAHRLLAPHRDAAVPAPAAGGVTPGSPADEAAALAWCTAERSVLVAVVGLAARSGFPAHAWQLAWLLTEFHARRGHWHEWIAMHRVTLDALPDGDDLGRAYTHRGIALALSRMHLDDEARSHLSRALAALERLGDGAGQGHVHLGLAWLLSRQDREAAALDHAQQALVLHRRAGNTPGEAAALNAVGWYHALLGEHRETLAYCLLAIPLHRAAGDRRGEAATWDSLGYAHHHLGDHDRAVDCLRRAAEQYHACGERACEADSLAHLGDAHDAAGNRAGAHQAWREALSLLDELGHRNADRLRDRLSPMATLT